MRQPHLMESIWGRTRYGGKKENEGGCSGASCIKINKLVQEPKGEFLKAQSLIVACFLHACMTVTAITKSRLQTPFLKENNWFNCIQRAADGFTLHFLSQNDSRHNSGGAVCSTWSNYGRLKIWLTIIEWDGEIINVSSLWKKVSGVVTPGRMRVRGCIIGAVSAGILPQLLRRVLLVARG